MTAKPEYSLTDGELIQALRLLATRPQLLREWERDFAASVGGQFIRSGWLSWKQRKSARLIVGRVMRALADIHDRHDLLEVPAPAPPAIVAPPVLRIVAPPDPKLIASKLSPQQRLTLAECVDGDWHGTTTRTGDGKISGASGKSVRRLGLLEDRGVRGDRTEYRLTELGRAVLMTYWTDEPARAAAVPEPKKPPTGVW